MDVECRSDRGRTEIAKYRLPAGATRVGCDRLCNCALAQREPIRTCAIVVHVHVCCPLQLISRIWFEVPDPRIEIHDPVCVVGLPELDVAKTAVAGYVAEDDLIVERRRFRAPAARAERSV